MSQAPVRVVWERLRLEGFGRHGDLEVGFPAGLGVWVAPNEAGKTTALLGLVAVVWGLPHAQDPAGFTWARFRPWGGGAQRGSVTLRAGDARFTVTRAFDGHRVRVVAHEPDGDRLLVDAVHNPNARKETSTYVPWLRATVGLVDADTVLATFVIAQGDLGGPRHAVDGDVQALVAGAGGGGWAGARERLEEALRGRTRRLRALDAGFARDGTVDRALEAAEARVARLEADLEAGRAVADAFERAQAAVRAADDVRTAARAERDRLAAAVAAQRAWTEAREAYLRIRARAGEARRGADAARGLAAEARRARAAAAACHPELAAAPVDLDARLEAWATATATTAAARTALAEAMAERESVARAAHAAVAAALAAERAVPRPPRDWSAWRAPAGADGAVATVDTAAPLDAAATVARARAACVRWPAALAAARAALDRLDAVDAALAPLAAFDDLDPALEPDVRGFAAERAAWAERLAGTATRSAAAAERVAAHAARYAPVRDADPDVAAALRAFAAADERPEGDAGGRWGGAAGVLLAVGLGAGPVASVLGRPLDPEWAWGAAAALALAWGLLWPRRRRWRQARARLRTLARAGRLDAAAAALGRDLDDDALLELGRRREAFEEHGDAVARDERDAAAAHAADAAAREGAAAFAARWAPWQAALAGAEPAAGGSDAAGVDVGAAHARWARLRGERAAAVERVRAAAAALLGDGAVHPEALRRAVAPSAPAAASGADGAWAAAWARFHGAVGPAAAGPDAAAATATSSEVAAWLARVGEATWARWAEEAEAADAAAAASRRAGERRRAAEAEAGRAVAERERAVRTAEERLAIAVGAERAARAAATGALGSVPEVDTDGETAGDTDSAAAGPPAAATGVAPATWSDPRAVREAWRAHRTARAAADAAEAAARAHVAALGLAAGDVDEGVAAAAAAAEGAAVDAGARLGAWRALAAEHPDLPPADPEAADAASVGVGDAFAAARAALAAAEAAAAAAETDALAAREALARAQGADPIDVAVVEVDLVAARADVARHRTERDALALALRTLDAAVDDFRGAHAQRLEAAAEAAFARFTGVPGRRVRLDGAFAAHVVEPGGDAAVPAQLSQGARDQLAIALRLAVADLLADDVRLPLVFDDPFLNWDEARSDRLAAALRAIAVDRQVLVLSHRAGLAAWGAPLEVRAG